MPKATRTAKIGQDRLRADFFDTAEEFMANREATGAQFYRFRDVSWTGGIGSTDHAHRTARAGDLALVAPSDRLLSALETVSPITSAWETIDDVAGAVPNVPAYLAGTPLTMRRRRRTVREAAPLAVYVDLTSSAGIDAETLMRRGAAILALVRVLSARRPVELWAGASLDWQLKQACAVFFRLDTAPLDLARAAHLLTHPSVPRGMCYGHLMTHYGAQGSWAFGAGQQAKWVRLARPLIEQIAPSSTEILFISPAFLAHDMSAAERWLKAMIAEHGGDFAEAA